MKKEKLKRLKRESRKYSIIEGSFSTVKASLGDSYITPFALAVNSSNSMIALLSSIPGFLGPLSQWFSSSTLMEKYKRKKIVSRGLLFESLMWLAMIAIAILSYKRILISSLPLLLLIFFSIYTALAHLSSPPWFSWMGDIVDEKNRGRWFAKRTAIHSTIAIIFTISAAFFLDFFKKHTWTIFGFMILFSLAMISRLTARYFMAKQYEPDLKLKDGHYFSFWQFIKKAPTNNFGKFSIFRALLNFSVMIASPFFAVYMLKNLQFSYTTYMIVTLSTTLFAVLTVRIWGKFADKYGNYQVMKLTSVFISLFPIFWLISDSPWFLIFVPQLVGGIAWAGFNLAAGNFVFDSVTPPKRGLAVSYFNVLDGCAILLGAGLGAILVKTINIQFMDLLLFIFLISAIARLIVSLFMISSFKEVRKTKTFDSSKVLNNIIPKTIKNLPEDILELRIKKMVYWR
ncbi:MAG: MFS transporter [Candidatus Pacearchaeota archaeon]